jgi:bifunctional non-homologous end joining protein LigD
MIFNMGLKRYQEKRDFKVTTEPSAGKETSRGPLTFVVQKHRARQLHYDFRLELDGVLKSWSVPKGPSLDPQAKHLAVMVEDHPLTYANFEGIIPKGEYGAGEVLVWDNGTYSPEVGGKLFFNNRDVAEQQVNLGLEKGKLSLFLRGDKLKGSWTLVKIKNKENDWLLMKHNDDYASPGSDILKNERSVLSDRTIQDVREQRLPDTKIKPFSLEDVPGVRQANFPSNVTPMLASLTDHPFSHPDWIFEPKLDGYRIIAQVKEGETTLLSRRGNNITRHYPNLVPFLNVQPASELIVDGEIIAMDGKGRQCFQCLQNYSNQTPLKGSERVTLIYYVFDVLYMDGYDLRGAALRDRKSILSKVFKSSEQVRLVDYFEREGAKIYEAAVKNGLEGVMAKRADSKYESGKRSHNWLKVKSMLSGDFVIGGFSVSKKGRSQTFSSLLIGYFNSTGKLIFAGHVGSGFDDRTLNDLKNRLSTLRIDDCPFSEIPALNAPTTWVRPELVAEIKFSEWTIDGRLRIPVFIRLREDKTPDEVTKSDHVTLPAPDPPIDPTSSDIATQLRKQKDNFSIDVEGNTIKLTNVDKILWPATTSHRGMTKRDLLIYLAEVSDYLLPHLKDRPLTLRRYPDGIEGEHFYQKHWGHSIPDFVKRVNIKEKSSTGEYLVCNNLSSLIWLGQLGNIEFHTWFSRISIGPDMTKNSKDDVLDYPDFIIFDLDPYIYSGQEPSGGEPELNRDGFAKSCETALWLKEILDKLDLHAFIKTSGRTGIHIYVPIKRNFNFKTVSSTAELVSKYLVREHPQELTTEWTQEKRHGKIFLDYNQNVRGKTLASVYSPRPTPEATISTPLRWEELGKVYPTDFTLTTLPSRLNKIGDLWSDILSVKRDLDNLTKIK